MTDIGKCLVALYNWATKIVITSYSKRLKSTCWWCCFLKRLIDGYRRIIYNLNRNLFWRLTNVFRVDMCFPDAVSFAEHPDFSFSACVNRVLKVWTVCPRFPKVAEIFVKHILKPFSMTMPLFTIYHISICVFIDLVNRGMITLKGFKMCFTNILATGLEKYKIWDGFDVKLSKIITIYT